VQHGRHDMCSAAAAAAAQLMAEGISRANLIRCAAYSPISNSKCVCCCCPRRRCQYNYYLRSGSRSRECDSCSCATATAVAAGDCRFQHPLLLPLLAWLPALCCCCCCCCCDFVPAHASATLQAQCSLHADAGCGADTASVAYQQQPPPLLLLKHKRAYPGVQPAATDNAAAGATSARSRICKCSCCKDVQAPSTSAASAAVFP
jgi:hypothetical protein